VPDRLLELLRPPAHRGPLIASGAVLVTLGILLEELRLPDRLALGVHLAILAVAAAVMLALGLQARPEGGRPPAFQSVLLVCGLVLLAPALARLADLLGADASPFPAGAVTWTALVYAGLALWPAIARRSAICALIGALALAVAALACVNWTTSADSATTYRWLLAFAALVYVLASLVLRAPAPRHAVQMVNAAGLAVLAIALTGVAAGVIGVLAPFGAGAASDLLPTGWELLVLAAGCGLVAYGAVDRAPGPAWLGVLNLAAFAALVGRSPEATLVGWPLIVLVLGLAAMAAGLRPRSPLPPEPDAYPSGTVPLASRTGAEETVVRVRDDGPPRP
jgi:hypothetical protein